METFLGGKVTLHCGDNREVIRTMADNSIDSIVTDPPYALVSIVKRFANSPRSEATENTENPYGRTGRGFMGQRWDNGGTVHAVEFWQECLRVLKPGGHVVAFAGTRTYHRMAVAIEDAGFEIRDCLFWHYGSGFPKSHNISKALDEKRCLCPTHLRNLPDNLDTEKSISSDSQPNMRQGLHESPDRQEECGASISVQPAGDDTLRRLREAKDRTSSLDSRRSETDLFADLQRDVARAGVGKARAQGCSSSQDIHCHVWTEESSMEGWGNVSKTEGQLRQRSICEMSSNIDINGSSGRLHNGASIGDGYVDGAPINTDGMRPSSGPQSIEQREDELGTLAGQSQSQVSGAWGNCRRCGKPIIPDGLGTALKPATEPICLARKSLIGTVAENVLQHGTGAINIDECKIGTEKRINMPGSTNERVAMGGGWRLDAEPTISTGRWPANLIHDGSDEVLAAFPESNGQQGAVTGNEPSGNGFSGHVYGYGGTATRKPTEPRGDIGSAARFFYTAKADSDDRIGSKHPTVKPIDLMQWLVRLVTPKGGLVLDPFAGTGTTAEACFREGMRCTIIERETEYQADIRRRMALVMAGPDERSRESIKAKMNGLPPDYGPLFGGLDTDERGGGRQIYGVFADERLDRRD